MSTAVSQVKQAYDELPYISHPFPQCAPENLAAVAHLFGLEAPDVAKARVLELGCSSGGNLIPAAARIPEAEFVGIDLSGVQIQLGKERIEALGLSNIRLQEADLSTLDTESLGVFDFIVCHGVYSWVPQHVQDAILRICKSNLSPDGVAYVSYNVYPGWKAKEIVRDAMMLRGAPRATPSERLGYAMGMLNFLEEVAPDNSVLAKTLELTLPDLRSQHEYYLSHEYLEPFNAPCYFQEFVKQADAHGMAYLAEAQPSTMFVSNYGPKIAEPLLKECGHSQVVLEQYLDFIANRTFRQTLLVHENRAGKISYRLDSKRFRNLHFAARLSGPDEEMTLDGSRRTYTVGTTSLVTESPEVKAALKVLSECWPETVSYDLLLQQADEKLDSVSGQASSSQIDGLLEQLIIADMAKFRRTPVCVAKPGQERITVDTASRKAAEISRDAAGAMTFNEWHEPVPLGIVAALLVPELDGSRERADLEASLHHHVSEGNLSFERNGKPVQDTTEIAACVTEHFDATMRRLMECKLIVSGS